MKSNLYILFFFIPFLSIAQLPTGAVAKYPLDASGSDIGGNSFNGTLSGATGTMNRFSTTNAAISLVSGVSTGTLPASFVTAVQNDFSVGFWFKTNMIGATGTYWYNASSMVDGEVGGVTNDWGIGLVDGGKVCFGIGNPDITIKSIGSSYNNNAWHFVTATRNKATGVVILYVDGAQVASTISINTASLNAPTVIGLGRSSAVATGTYTGALDDMLAYNRVLTPTEVSNMYTYFQSSASLPVQWVSFAGNITGSDVQLKWETANSVNNDHFDVEHSGDGIAFSVAGTLNDKDGKPSAGNGMLYAFSTPLPVGTTHYYRIRQVDADGKSTLSSTIKLQSRNNTTALHLQSNPVGAELALVNNQQLIIKKLQVLDMSGRTILDKKINNSNPVITLNTQQLMPGHYLLRIVAASGNSTIALIKQ